jgi:arabinogalactan endo-1,4-beta-galactosidase
MQGTDYTTGPIRGLRDALNTYTTTGAYTNYAGTVQTQHNTLAPLVAAVKTAFDSVPGTIVAGYSNKATPLKAGPSTAPPSTALAATYVNDANTAVTDLSANALSDMTTTVKPPMQNADASYDALGATPSAVSPETCVLPPVHTLMHRSG